MVLATTLKTIAVPRTPSPGWRPFRPAALAHVFRASRMEGQNGATFHQDHRSRRDCAATGLQGLHVSRVIVVAAKMFPPQRIVCLTEETVETLYLLGEQDSIVGISGYCVRPPEARRDKPRVSAFISADIPKILDLKPDLVLSFSDLQADIVAALVRQGVSVHAFNQRSVAEILEMILTLGALVGVAEKAAALVASLQANLDAVR